MISRCAISGRKHRIRASPFRWYSSTPARPKKDLPPPLPPKPSSSSSSSKPVSPAQVKKEYIEAQKRTGEFLKDPQANIARIQAEMDQTKRELLKVHDKPIWKRVRDRFKAKQHAVINLLAASMAYILAHSLHLKIKASDELNEQFEQEKAKNSELRKLLKSLQTQDFAGAVVAQATTNESSSTTSNSSWFRSDGGKKSSVPETNALITSLRLALEARIGDEGLEDADRKEKNIQEIWQENEERIETEDGLVELAQAIAVEGTVTDSSKKRVFDM